LSTASVTSSGPTQRTKEITVALKYVQQPPAEPFVLAGEAKVSFPDLPSPTIKYLLALGNDSPSVTDAWGKIFRGFSMKTSRDVLTRLGHRDASDTMIFYTVELSQKGPEATIRFYV
jgi:hypothetical protein